MTVKTPTEQVSVRLPTSVIGYLQDLAINSNRSMANLISTVVIEFAGSGRAVPDYITPVGERQILPLVSPVQEQPKVQASPISAQEQIVRVPTPPPIKTEAAKSVLLFPPEKDIEFYDEDPVSDPTLTHDNLLERLEEEDRIAKQTEEQETFRKIIEKAPKFNSQAEAVAYAKKMYKDSRVQLRLLLAFIAAGLISAKEKPPQN
jgi:hypothetical protein